MARISQERLQEYRQIARQPMTELGDPVLQVFLDRVIAEGMDLRTDGFTGLGFFRAPVRKALDEVDIAFVGVPFDFGTPWSSGTRKGPEFVRRWSQKPAWFKNFSSDLIPFEVCNVIDYGDLDLFFKESSQALDVLTEVYAKFRQANVSPITVGGEHTETYGILRGYVDPEEPVALIHFDAHTDTGGIGQGDPVNDGTFFTAAIVEGRIEPQHMVQIGIRNGLSYAMANRSRELGITVYLIEDVEECGVGPIVNEVRKRIGDRPCYLSFDTDAIDAAYMPGTTVPEPFGLTGREVKQFLRGFKGMNFIGADLVETNPSQDTPFGSTAANLSAAVLNEVFHLVAEARVKRTGQKRPTHWNN